MAVAPLTPKSFICGFPGTPSVAPDLSTLSKTRRLMNLGTHKAMFRWVLKRLAKEGLLSGKNLGVDATTLEANAGSDPCGSIQSELDSADRVGCGYRPAGRADRIAAVCSWFLWLVEIERCHHQHPTCLTWLPQSLPSFSLMPALNPVLSTDC
jgi:hypothetical protein